jgi:AraC-like DNA-binding protein
MTLLRTTELGVGEVCLEVGFTSFGTFSRTFGRIVGEAPSTYRRRTPLPDVPTCFAMAWMRQSSFGQATAAARP